MNNRIKDLQQGCIEGGFHDLQNNHPEYFNIASELMKLQKEKEALTMDETTSTLARWMSYGNDYDKMREELIAIKGGTVIQDIVDKRTKEEGIEKAGKLWKYLDCFTTHNVVKANTLKGGRRSRKRKKRGGNITKEIGNLHELERDEEYLLIITVRGRNGGKDITSRKVLYKSTTDGRYNFLLVNSSSGRHIVLNEEDHERTNDIGGWIILKYGLSGGRKKSKKRRKRNLKKRTKRRRRSKRRRRR